LTDISLFIGLEIPILWNIFNALSSATTGIYGNIISMENICEPGIKIYPNPAFENLYIELNFEKDYKVSIYYLLGRKLNLLPQKQFNKLVLDISGFKNGIYLLKIEGTDYNQSKKIVINGNSN